MSKSYKQYFQKVVSLKLKKKKRKELLKKIFLNIKIDSIWLSLLYIYIYIYIYIHTHTHTTQYHICLKVENLRVWFPTVHDIEVYT